MHEDRRSAWKVALSDALGPGSTGRASERPDEAQEASFRPRFCLRPRSETALYRRISSRCSAARIEDVSWAGGTAELDGVVRI
ncbi:hypothetical protein THAOC_29729, partial [Thalassiosira oceanica]